MSVDQLGHRHTSPACRPVTPPSRRWEKKRSRSQLVQSSERSISLDARRARRRRSQTEAEVEHAPVGDVLAEIARTRRAPPPPPRSSTGRCPGRSPPRSPRPRARRARRSRRRARASRSGSSRRRRAPTSATGRQSATNTSGARPSAEVAQPSTSAGSPPAPRSQAERSLGSSWRTTSAPCTCLPETIPAGSTPKRLAHRSAVRVDRRRSRRRSEGRG